MGKGKGISAPIRVDVDQGSLRQAESAIERAMALGGERGGAAMSRALKAASDLQLAELSKKFRDGLIDERTFLATRQQIQMTFGRALSDGMDKLRHAGKLTEAEFVKLSRELERTSRSAGRTGQQLEQHLLGAAEKVERGWRGVLQRLRGGGGGLGGLLQGAVIGVASGGTTAAISAVTGALSRGAAAARNFLTSSVTAAAESERPWSTLRNTLSRIGVDLEDVQSDLQERANAIQRSTEFDDEAAIEGFEALVRGTRDYQGSLQNLGLVADIAAGKNISMAEAGQLVARAMRDPEMSLRRVGVATLEGETAMEALRRSFGGMAESEGRDLAGQLTQTHNIFGNLKEAVGGVIGKFLEHTGILRGFNNLMESATSWLVKNQDRIVEWGEKALDAAKKVFEITRKVWELAGALGSLIARPYRVAVEFGADWARMWNGLPRWLRTALDRGGLVVLRIVTELMPGGDLVNHYLNSRRSRASAPEGTNDAFNSIGENKDGKARGTAPPDVDLDYDNGGSGGRRRDALKEEVDLLADAARNRLLNAQEMIRILDLQKQFNEELRATGTTLERREYLSGLSGQLQEAWTTIVGGLRAGGFVAPTSSLQRFRPRGMDASGMDDAIGAELRDSADQYRKDHAGEFSDAEGGPLGMAAEDWDSMQMVAEDVAGSMVDSFGEAFAMIGSDLSNLGGAFTAFFEGVAKGVLNGLRQEAGARAKKELAEALSSLGKGLYLTAIGGPGAGAAFASAKMHFASAAAWSAAFGGASALGGGGGAGGGAGGGGGSGGAGGGGGQERPGPEMHRYSVFAGLPPMPQDQPIGARLAMLTAAADHAPPSGLVRADGSTAAAAGVLGDKVATAIGDLKIALHLRHESRVELNPRSPVVQDIILDATKGAILRRGKDELD